MPVTVRRLCGPVTIALAFLAGAAAAGDFVTFESGQIRPLALSPDGKQLFAVDTPDDRLEIFDVTAAGLTHRATVPVGMEPVAVAARSTSEVWVVNLLSDSVSIVDVAADPPRVVRTLLSATSHATSSSPVRVEAAPSSPRRTAASSGPIHPSQRCPARATRSSPRPASAGPTSGSSTRTRPAPRSAVRRSAS